MSVKESQATLSKVLDDLEGKYRSFLAQARVVAAAIYARKTTTVEGKGEI